MSTESVMPSNHLILCHPLPLLPSIFPGITGIIPASWVFPNELALRVRWPKYWSFSFSTRGGEHTSEGRRPPCVCGGRHWGDEATSWGHLEPQKLEEAGRAVPGAFGGGQPCPHPDLRLCPPAWEKMICCFRPAVSCWALLPSPRSPAS